VLTADSANRKATSRVAFLTGASIFVMGYLNGYALNTADLGSMITAQTGNVVWLGLNAAAGYWTYFFENLGLFVGFIAGVVFALYTQNSFQNKRTQFYFNWTVFIVPVLLYPLALQYVVPPWVSFLVLGFASGAALGFFRKMYHLEINNAMATGNVRFFGLHFAGAYMKKNKKEVSTFWIFVLCTFLFAFGAFCYAMLARLDYMLGFDLHLGLGYYYRDYNDYSRFYRTLGLGYERGYVILVASNVARIVGFIVFCLIPYFFCPTPKQPKTEDSATGKTPQNVAG